VLAHPEDLKARLGHLATVGGRIKSLKRSLTRNFFEIGALLAEIEHGRLYEVKGYGSFEAFLERETDVGTQLGLQLTRIARTFQAEAALAAGLERTQAALAALEGEAPESSAPPATSSGGTGPALPPHKR
jgi:hypothetical protein